MNIRLKQFLSAENISQSQFADTIKVVRASVSHVLAGRNKPGYDFIKAIMLAYPHLNMEWLIIGKGKMYKSSEDLHEVPLQTPAPPPLPTDEGQPLLFNYDEQDDIIPEESPFISVAEKNNVQYTDKINTLDNTQKNPDNKRKAIKIYVFYNDGTYQEFQGLQQ